MTQNWHKISEKQINKTKSTQTKLSQSLKAFVGRWQKQLIKTLASRIPFLEYITFQWRCNTWCSSKELDVCILVVCIY